MFQVKYYRDKFFYKNLFLSIKIVIYFRSLIVYTKKDDKKKTHIIVEPIVSLHCSESKIEFDHHY